MGEVATPHRLRPVRGLFCGRSTRRVRRAPAGRCESMSASAADADSDSGRTEGVGVLVQGGGEQLVEAGDHGAVLRACGDLQAMGEPRSSVCADDGGGGLGVEAAVDDAPEVVGADATP